MSLNFTEAKLEQVILELLADQGYTHYAGNSIARADYEEVLIEYDLQAFLTCEYKAEGITSSEIDSIIRELKALPANDLYESNKIFCNRLCNGFLFKREDRNQKDLYIQLINTQNPSQNIYKVVNQLEIEGRTADGGQIRIPDAILYINGLPLVLFEFKSTVREEATIYNAYVQIHTRYRRDIPKLFVYNALCILSDGINSKMGNVFAPYEVYSAWRKVTGDESVEGQGIQSLYTMMSGLFDQSRLLDVLKNFIYFPDTSNNELKICCRYPQYYAANKLFINIKKEQKPQGSGKGGTYFGATGCGKSFTMLFLTRLLMKSVDLASPTIVLITDRIDLDKQLSEQFVKAKTYVGDNTIISVKSRENLRELLKGRNSGGVFLSTIYKFTEDIQLLSTRTNIICIADEAHRSQVNLEQKIRMDAKKGIITKKYGLAKYLHNSLPNATYVGFTGTPIDATLNVFGNSIDMYTMTESVNDGITVRIVYEGRAAKIILDNAKLKEIDKYYNECAEIGANEHQIEESKKASAKMYAILGDPSRLAALAKDFVNHYEKRDTEVSRGDAKVMFVCYNRDIAFNFYKAIKCIRPEWFEVRECHANAVLTEKERQAIIPSELVKLVMTRDKDDELEHWNLVGTKEYRKELDRQFKNEKSNFKIAIVVDMWLTGFDVPCLDTIYIDKPLQKHNLIQTISRVNRKYKDKNKGLVVDYIGIKKAMNLALAHYSKGENKNFEDIAFPLKEVKDHLDLLKQLFHTFDNSHYFMGEPSEQFACLNRAVEFVLATKKSETFFMGLVKRLRAAYEICCASEELSQNERDYVHFYMAVRSIVFKLTKGDAPDINQMNARVRDMIAEALKADGVEEIFKLGEKSSEPIDIFDAEYLERISKIKLPNTKILLLQKLLAKAITDFKKSNKLQGMIFSDKFQSLVEQYNNRKENDALKGEEFEPFTAELLDMIDKLKAEMQSFADMGIDANEKSFYDILAYMAQKYNFTYPEDKLLELAKRMKIIVDDKAKYPDWSRREDIKAELKADLIMLLHEFGYPPVTHDEVYRGVLEQAVNFKKNLQR